MTETSEQTPTTGKKSGKNTLIIIIVVVFILLAIGGFAMQKLTQKASEMIGQKVGEKVVESAIESAAGGKADVDIDSDSVTVKTKEGSFSTGTSLPSDWPKDAPVYPGATVTFSGSSNPESGDTGYSVTLSTNDSYQKVSDYYTKELPAQGWKVTSTQQIANSSVMAATKDTRTMSVAVVSAEGATNITLVVGTDSQ